MAYNKNVGIIDDFNGIYDCAKSILRAVNNPFLRFEEDALRILRAMRFASVYSLSIEKNTALAMKEKFNLLTNVSAERVLSEFSKCLMGENADAVLKEFSKIVCFIFPELKSVNDINKVFSAISLVDDLTQKFAILFSQCADQVKKICKRLKFTNLMRDEITLILSKIDFCSYDNPIEIKYLMKDLNNTVFSLIIVKYSLAITSNDKILQNNLNKMRNICKQIINENQCYNLAQLALKGDHLLKYSITGEDLKKKLNFALDGVICGKVGNNTQEILNYLGLCDYE